MHPFSVSLNSDELDLFAPISLFEADHDQDFTISGTSSANDNDLTLSYEDLIQLKQHLEKVSSITATSNLENPEEEEVSMQLTIRGESAMKLRSIERFAVKAAYAYSDAFELRYALTKTGVRIMRGQEQALVTFSAEKTQLTIKAKFKTDPSNGFRGVIVAYFGVLVYNLQAGQFDFTVEQADTKLPNLKVVEDWGRWAYQKLHAADPKGMPALIGG